MYFDVLKAATTVGHRDLMIEGVQAIRRIGGLESVRATDLLPFVHALMVSDGVATATPLLRRALDAFESEPLSTVDELHSLEFACVVAIGLWDDERTHALAARYVALTREAGALTLLPLALELYAAALVRSGDLDGAQAQLDEAEAIIEATGGTPLSDVALMLAGWRGDEAAACERIERTIADAALRGEENTITLAEYIAATLFNALGPPRRRAGRGAALLHAPPGQELRRRRSSSSWNPACAAAPTTTRLTRLNACARPPRSPGPTGRSGSRPVRVRC